LLETLSLCHYCAGYCANEASGVALSTDLYEGHAARIMLLPTYRQRISFCTWQMSYANNRKSAAFVKPKTPITVEKPQNRFHVCSPPNRVKNRTLSFSAFEFPQNALSVRVGFHFSDSFFFRLISRNLASIFRTHSRVVIFVPRAYGLTTEHI
jgi:hypothetical protein